MARKSIVRTNPRKEYYEDMALSKNTNDVLRKMKNKAQWRFIMVVKISRKSNEIEKNWYFSRKNARGGDPLPPSIENPEKDTRSVGRVGMG